MSEHADPMFGTARTVGFARPSRRPSPSRVDPPEPPPYADSEPAAPYCTGPGHLYAPDPDAYDREPGDLLVRIEDCPSCVGQVRNHRESRLVISARIAEAFQ